MEWFKDQINLTTRGKGFYPITRQVEEHIHTWNITEGVCFLFVQHTSASLAICESYDPSARQDLGEFLERLAPENQSWHSHGLEGSDDSPSHMRSLVTPVDLTIPIDQGRLSLGSWQGIHLCEHRSGGHRRTVLLRCLKVR